MVIGLDSERLAAPVVSVGSFPKTVTRCVSRSTLLKNLVSPAQPDSLSETPQTRQTA